MSASCFLLAVLCCVLWGYEREKGLAGRVALYVLRFHVLANSNGTRDQAVKEEVKSYVLEMLHDCPARSKDEFSSYINENKKELEEQIGRAHV